MADDFVRSLLKDWGLEEFISIFEENGIISQQLLVDMDEALIKVVFINKVNELQFLDKWPSFAMKHGRVDLKTNRFSFNSALFALITKSEIEKILMRHFNTRGILRCYARTNELTDQDSNLVVEAIVCDLLNVSFSWCNEHFAQIAGVIVAIFPSETVHTYYIPPIEKKDSAKNVSEKAGGKVPDKMRNKKAMWNLWLGTTRKRKRDETEADTDVKKPRIEDESMAIQKSVQWLSTHDEPREELVLNWTISAPYRNKWIAGNKNPSVQAILDHWPILMRPQMPMLILIDFERIHKNAVKGKGIEGWSQFVEILSTKVKCAKDDVVGKGLKDIMALEETSEDGLVLSQLQYLAHLFPPKGNAKCNEKDEKGNSKRVSTSESVDSLLRRCNNVGELKIMQEQVITSAGKSSVQPYIIAVGPHISVPTSFVISIDKHAFKVANALQAIDVTFKLFHVLDIEYPPASCHIWHLLQWGLYKMTTSKDKSLPWMRKAVKHLTNAGF